MLAEAQVVVLPFLIGLVTGAIVRKAAKLAALFLSLFVLLVAFGSMSLSPSEWFARLENSLPLLYRTTSSMLNLLPYSSLMFAVGFVLGLFVGK